MVLGGACWSLHEEPFHVSSEVHGALPPADGVRSGFLEHGPLPIDADAHASGDSLDLMRARAEGEASIGRSDGAASQAYREAMAPQGELQAKPHASPAHRCGPLRVQERVIAETPWKKVTALEPVLPKGSPKAKHKPPLRFGGGPKIPSREQLVSEGPFPLEKRMAELAAHAYYLWGDARHLHLANEGAATASLARTVERFAKQADTAARVMCRNAHIPMASAPPNLPLAVSALPLDVFLLAPVGVTAQRWTSPSCRGFL